MMVRISIVAVTLMCLAACGGEQYSAPPAGGGGGGGGGGGDHTGLLIDLQRMDLPLRATLEKWSVVDGARNPLFSSDQVIQAPMGGIDWEYKREKALSLSTRPWLGTNHLEVDATFELSEDQKSAQIIVGDAAAASLRGMGTHLGKLVANGRIVILVGKIGE